MRLYEVERLCLWVLDVKMHRVPVGKCRKQTNAKKILQYIPSWALVAG